jgi:hypothetical protein
MAKLGPSSTEKVRRAHYLQPMSPVQISLSGSNWLTVSGRAMVSHAFRCGGGVQVTELRADSGSGGGTDAMSPYTP